MRKSTVRRSHSQSVPVLSGMLIERKPPFVQNSQSHVLVTPGGGLLLRCLFPQCSVAIAEK